MTISVTFLWYNNNNGGHSIFDCGFRIVESQKAIARQNKVWGRNQKSGEIKEEWAKR
jgi:hypothetical protein